MRAHLALLVATLAGLAACDRIGAAPVREADLVSASMTQLNVGFQQQDPMLCVPTAASMIMAHYGDAEPPRKLKALSRGQTYDPAGPFSDFTITWYRDLVRAAARLGYAWTEQDVADDDVGFSQGLSILRSELLSGHPVLIDLSLPDGHTVVAAGFDEAAQSLLVVDPNAVAPGRYAIPYARLRDVWNEHAFGHAVRSLVIAPPRAT